MYEKLAHCPLCKSEHFTNYMVVKDHSISKESFSICKCSHCDFLFTNPRPTKENTEKYYSSENYISHKDKTTNLTNLLYKIVRKFTLKKKVKWLNENTNSRGRLLDFGCGTGKFLRSAEKDGWKAVGLEPNKEAASMAIQRHGSKVFSTLSELEGEKKFDAITLFHVLEHVHNLKSTLDFLLSKLKKRGSLFIAVPNFHSYDAEFYKENWAALDVPRNLYHFTPQTMEVLAKEFGLNIKSTKPLIFDSYYVSILSESYINNKKKLINPILIGNKSNRIARKTNNNYSSLLYILKKL